MANVLLLSPPYIDLYGNLRNAAGRYFPLGLGYIASYLRKYGDHAVQMYEPEAQGLTYTDIAEKIRTSAPDIVGITCTTPNYSRAIELAKVCRMNSTAKIVIGGVHVSALPQFVMEEHAYLIDCVVVGEGEETMLEVVNAFQNNLTIENIKGLVYNNRGKITRNESRPFIEDLDSIPVPARDLIPQYLFKPNMHNARYRNCYSVLTSRGCPFKCSFCAARIVSGVKYRMHSAEYVLEEIDMLKREYSAQQIIITDDTFTLDHARLEKICKGMIDKKYNLAWFCFSQVNTVDKKMLSLMRQAGCYSIGFGVESASESVLKRMGKPIKPERVKETISIANRLGIKTQAFYILGSPGETRMQMEDTIRFSREVNATLAFYNMLVPYPGTREFDRCFASVPLKNINWEQFVAVGESCVIRNPDVSPREIEQLIGTANIIYYANFRRLVNLLFRIKTFYEFINYVRGALSLLKQIGKWSKVFRG